MNKLELTGLDGSNPVAFLAALGTLRALTLAWPDKDVRMSWSRVAGWMPVLHARDIAQEDVVRALHDEVERAAGDETLGMANDLTIPVGDYRKHLIDQLSKQHDPESLAYAAAFGCDAIGDNKGNISDTALRTMSGAGHQHFLKTMRDVLGETTPAHVTRTLFESWRYEDPLRGRSLRFDPLDDKRRALQWYDPSGDPTRNTSGNVLGANALAVLGIPLLVVVPLGGRLETTGFRGHRSNDCFWTWPLWGVPLTLAAVAPLLALQELQADEVSRDTLTARGVVEVFRSQRITVGKFRNFTPARPV